MPAAVTDAYATASEYRTAIGKTDTASDADILLDLKAVSRHIEGKVGRFFNKDASAVARVYIPGVTGRLLRVDDMAVAPTSIKIDYDGDYSFTDETALVSTEYELRPLNADKGPEARPWTQIYLYNTLWLAGQRVQVTAQFGWAAVPDAVKRACIRLTSILRLESPWATQRIPELDQAIAASPEATNILRALMDSYQVVRYV